MTMTREDHEADRHRRPPGKGASPALIAACRADYREAKADDDRRPPDPFKYAPLGWEDVTSGAA
ncbi:hypothetical protein AB0O82_06460 [Kitasatospora sp. NPDC088264]|uniref:hypothetical protein n=1 Tax=unclassified Kitasatospora TaxID=2633591 RepID=UPI003444CF2F